MNMGRAVHEAVVGVDVSFQVTHDGEWTRNGQGGRIGGTVELTVARLLLRVTGCALKNKCNGVFIITVL